MLPGDVLASALGWSDALCLASGGGEREAGAVPAAGSDAGTAAAADAAADTQHAALDSLGAVFLLSSARERHQQVAVNEEACCIVAPSVTSNTAIKYGLMPRT